MATTTSGSLRTVVVPGNHDGVHRGHRALLARAGEVAQRLDARVTGLFFDPHPTAVLRPERARPPLTTAARRAELLAGAGATRVHVEPFTRDLAAASPEHFARDLLCGRLGARAVVVGPDFRFGRDRAGDTTTLTTLGAQLGFEVVVVPEVAADGTRISSSAIRALLEAGDVAGAATGLARYHETEGIVVTGQRLGRTLGYPTANLAETATLTPADGIYAVVARVLDDGARAVLHGVASLGARPTVDAGRALEVHLFDVDRDLYGRRLRAGWVARLRSEARFDSLAALTAQMHEDARAARDALAHMNTEYAQWL